MSVKESLSKIKTYLKDLITDLRKSDTYKMQLMFTINFVYSKYANEE